MCEEGKRDESLERDLRARYQMSRVSICERRASSSRFPNRRKHDRQNPSHPPCRRRTAQLHEGRAGVARARRAQEVPPHARSHRPALRRQHVEGLLRRPATPAPGRPPGRGLGEPRRADREGHAGLRARAEGHRPRSRRRGGRRQLDHGVHAGGDEARRPRGARRSGAAQLRPHDAGRDQPHGDRHSIRPALHDLDRSARQPHARGRRRSRRSISWAMS